MFDWQNAAWLGWNRLLRLPPGPQSQWSDADKAMIAASQQRPPVVSVAAARRRVEWEALANNT
jgi:hypothetical protein